MAAREYYLQPESRLACREPLARSSPPMIPCSTYEFRDEPAEVLEKVLVQDAEVLVCSPEDLVRTGRTRPVAVLMSIARYERYAEIEAQLRELGRAFAESN